MRALGPVGNGPPGGEGPPGEEGVSRLGTGQSPPLRARLKSVPVGVCWARGPTGTGTRRLPGCGGNVRALIGFYFLVEG